mmetsp:Transcript_30359/g.64290  ORF Transcript_30359/g.64290 Transcript_30359/m.64290 type:complete len:654 (+) Transcript_30359:1-1962(+)
MAVGPGESEGGTDTTAGLTLIAAICMMMLMYYLTNYNDEDVRKYTYEIVNSTVSIFCAVLLFSAGNELTEDLFLNHLEKNPMSKFLIRLSLTVGFYAALQLALMWATNQFSAEEKVLENGQRRKLKPGDRMGGITYRQQTKLRLVSSGLIMAHLTGFSAISAGGALQQSPWFRQNPFTTFLVVPLAIVFLVGMGKITECLRRHKTFQDGDKDWQETLWDEQVKEAENDVVSLAGSFLLVQTMRFLIGGSLPDAEGEEELEVLFQHKIWEVVLMYLFGFACVGMVVFLLVFVRSFTIVDEEEEEREEAERAEEDERALEEDSSRDKEQKPGSQHKPHRTSGPRSVHDGYVAMGSEAHKKLHIPFTKIMLDAERSREIITTFTSMAAAWSFFFATRWLLAISGIVGDDETMLGISLALALSVVSFLWVIVLDWKHDEIRGVTHKTEAERSRKVEADTQVEPEHATEEEDKSKRIELALKRIIAVCGILVGFGWEQCFDGAVAAAAAPTSNPIMVKCFLAFFCVLIVAPAWILYLLPMVVLDGWRFGFLPHFVVQRGGELVKTCPVANKEFDSMLLDLTSVKAETDPVHRSVKAQLLKSKTGGLGPELEDQQLQQALEAQLKHVGRQLDGAASEEKRALLTLLSNWEFKASSSRIG